MSFPRYPDYKDSGVEWLGTVPGHWQVKRIRHIAQLNPSKTEIKQLDPEMLVSFLPMEAVGDAGSLNLERETTIAEVQSGYTYFREGDVTYAKITPCFENGKGAHMRGLLNGIGFGSTELVAVRPDYSQTTSEYLNWIFRSPVFRRLAEANMYGAGGQKRVPDEFTRDFALGLPNIEEQVLISRFLFSETAKLDDLMAEQEKLIALLKEKRQAVIAHAVTKGLNPTVSMKHSRIEWLGEVPVHWEVRRIRFVAQLNPSKSEIKALDPEMQVSFLPMEAVGDDGSLSLDREKAIYEVETGYTYFRDGDVTFAKITPCFENGKGAHMHGLLNGIGFGSTELVAARPYYSKTTSEYLNWIFRSPQFRRWGEASMYGAGGQKRVPDDFVRNFALAFPNIAEQVEISNFLIRETAKHDELIAEAQKAIDLLKERRSALISAAVTGQIDVRGLIKEEQEQAA